LQILFIGIFFIAVSLCGSHLKKHGKKYVRIIYRGCCLAFMAYLFVCGVISAAMLSGSMNLPPQNSDATAVVLGCQVIGDRPSTIFRRRLEAAYEYLSLHPRAKCVLTGGQGKNEIMPESEVAKNWLIEKGITPDRLYTETKSTDTNENLGFAYEIIKENGLSEDIVIVTDRFHELRAAYTAKHAGFSTVYACPAETFWYFTGHYWFRDMGGVGLIWLFGDDAFKLQNVMR
jgi:uncharacterized SAM-binding protein YcdF (DUF218 family)